MTSELEWARQETVSTLDGVPFLVPWAFEFTPASSEEVKSGYLRKVRESDFVIWLVKDITTDPVRDEIREALASNRRLWVFRFPAGTRDPDTDALLAQVASRAKWADVKDRDELKEALALTFADEIVRAVRDKPGMSHLARLEEVGRASRGRCVMRWQGAGLRRAQALEFADERDLGAPGPSLLPSHAQPLVVLAGDIGAGKSLMAERAFQTAIEAYRNSVLAPIPIFLDARNAAGQLEEAVFREADGLGDPRSQGVSLIIDGADEARKASALNLLDEGRVMVTRWPGSTILITTRPLPWLIHREETAEIPTLTEAETYAILSRIVGYDLTQRLVSWPGSVQEAIKRPLFAVLLGTYLVESEDSPRSTVDLVSSLVRRMLERARLEEEAGTNALRRLAAQTIERGGPIPPDEVASLPEIDAMVSTGLVAHKEGGIAFPLPILEEWFGAQSLAEGFPAAEDLASDPARLDRWQFAMILAAGSFPHEVAMRLLGPVARNDPGAAAPIVLEAFTYPNTDRKSPGTIAEAGKRIRETMMAWLDGLGPIGKLLDLSDLGGTLRPLGLAVGSDQIMASWYRGGERMDPIVDLNKVGDRFREAPTFAWRSGPRAAEPAWAWSWTFQELQRGLKEVVQREDLPLDGTALVPDFVWTVVAALCRRSSLKETAIPLADVQHELSSLPKLGTYISTGLRIDLPSWQIDLVKSEIARLVQQGASEIKYPWPEPDTYPTDSGSRWIWDYYTPGRILERATAVYSTALRGYEELIHAWFPKVGRRFAKFATLPARLVGFIEFRATETRLGEPTLYWYLDPLPRGRETDIHIELGSPGEESNWEPLLRNIRRERAEEAEWLFPVVAHSALDIFDPKPAVKLAHSWLQRDLRELRWLRY